MKPHTYDDLVEHARVTARDHGIDKVFEEYDINVLLGPAESTITHFASAAGGSIPLKVWEMLTQDQDTPLRLFHSATSISTAARMDLLR